MGFENSAAKFFWFSFVIFLTLNLMAFYGVAPPFRALINHTPQCSATASAGPGLFCLCPYVSRGALQASWECM